MPRSIKPEDKPVSVAVDQAVNPTQYVILDVAGNKRAHFMDMADAEEYKDAANAEPALMQSDMHDTGVKRPTKRRVKPKGRKMPRGIPKKKTAKKKSAKSAVKKTVQKTMKRRKKRKA